MAPQIARPVQTLRDQSTSFEAALSVCLADPKVKAVHKLRTESRRLEAQIALLESIKGIATFRTEAGKALLQIKKLRQAAGRVRDLDVQTGRLEEYATKTRAALMPEEEKKQMLADLEQMLTERAERRERAAHDLVSTIEGRQQKVAAALEKLNSTLKHAGRRSLASRDLLKIAELRFARTQALRKREPSADELHTIRKAAKQARYVAENASAKTATEAAKRFEHLQELGGEWHDWLDLAAAARKELGKKHALAGEFLALRDHNLQRFCVELEKLRPAVGKKAAKATKIAKQ